MNWIFLKRISFLRFLIPFVIGIIFQIKTAFFEKNIFYFFLFLNSIFITLFFVKKINKNSFFNQFFGKTLFLIFFTLGIYLTALRQETFSSKIFNVFQEKKISIVEISEEINEKKNYVFIIAKLLWTKKLKNTYSYFQNEKVFIYIEKDSLSKKLKIGDQIFINGRFNEIEKSKNPGQFDYKNYLKILGVHKQIFLKKDQWKIFHKKNSLWKKARNFRGKLLKIYKEFILNNENYSVVAALTLGYKKDLSSETERNFSASGAMHILAVSGLHVGIIYLFLIYLLFFLENGNKRRILRLVILFIFVWSYAFLTGFSVPVIRASLMLCFYEIGKTFNRSTNVYSSLSVAAFVLLFYDPFYIVQVGFLLSFFAVIGIVHFVPKISKNLIFDYKNQKTFLKKIFLWFLNTIWVLFCVSLAAQIAIFPISIYIFNIFPVYFLITNLIVIKLAALIILFAIIFFISYSVNFFPHFLSKILNYLLDFLNYSVSFIENLPFSVYEVKINFFQTVFMYIFVILFAFFLKSKKIKYLKLSLTVFIITFLSLNLENFKNQKTKKFIVYSIKKSFAVDFIKNKESFLMLEGKIKNDENLQNYFIKANHLNLGIKRKFLMDFEKKNFFSFCRIFLGNYYFSFENKKILILKKNAIFCKKNFFKLKIDYLILDKFSKINLEKIFSYFDVNQIILSNYSKYEIKNFVKECKSKNIKIWNVSEEGAFVLNL